MKYDICCIGHITLDHIVTPHSDEFMPGGTAWYFAHAMASLDAGNFLLVTSLGKDQMQSVETLRQRGVDVKAINSRKTVFFENIYGADPNVRTQRVLSKADPFDIHSLDGLEANLFHLGALLSDDFSTDFIPKLAERGRISVDSQGFLRSVKDSNVEPCHWADKLAILPYVDILKANEQEMVALTGQTDPYEAARQLAQWGVKEVVITLGDAGSLILKDGRYYRIPAFKVNHPVDPTGCGDTYMAAYLLAESRGLNIDDAGRFAARICTRKLGKSGALIC